MVAPKHANSAFVLRQSCSLMNNEARQVWPDALVGLGLHDAKPFKEPSVAEQSPLIRVSKN